MRFVKVLAALVLCAAALLSGSVTAFADTDVSGSAWDELLCKEVELEQYDNWIKSLRLERLEELPKPFINGKRLIESYDISSDGKIAIAYTDESLIAVYDENFDFQYAISFWINSEYGVLWCGNHIALMHVRGDGAILLDEDANPVAMYKIIDNNSDLDYWNEIVKSRTRKWEQYTYFCYDRYELEFCYENSGTTAGRHVLERTNVDGNIEVLYEEEEEHWWESVLVFVLIIAVLSLIIFRVHRTNKIKAQAIIKRHYQEGKGVGYTPPLRKV